jgi:histidyl-tRNA synthetase
LIAVDKLDKIGQDGVSKELHKRDFSQDQTDALWGLLEAGDQDEDTLTRLEDKLAKISDEALRKEALEGVSGLRRLSGEALALGMHAEAFTVDPTLARGLDYYTGPVFEIAHPDLSGSLGGGGRYDGLIESLGGPALPAVGISLGLERIILILQERENASTTQVATEVLVTVFDDTLRNASLKTAASMRSEGLNVDMYASEGKLRKQFKYADALGIPWLVVLGPDEAEKQTVTLKHLVSGDQFNLTLEQACEHVRKARALPSDEPTG